jgi:hypothetical protein
MRRAIEIIEILNKILLEKEPVRSGLINSFQAEVFNDESIIDEVLEEIVANLAYDLDFYEPNEEGRKESNSFYGSEQLEEIIKKGILQIQNYNKALELKPAAHE